MASGPVRLIQSREMRKIFTKMQRHNFITAYKIGNIHWVTITKSYVKKSVHFRKWRSLYLAALFVSYIHWTLTNTPSNLHLTCMSRPLQHIISSFRLFQTIYSDTVPGLPGSPKVRIPYILERALRKFKYRAFIHREKLIR